MLFAYDIDITKKSPLFVRIYMEMVFSDLIVGNIDVPWHQFEGVGKTTSLLSVTFRPLFIAIKR